MNKQELLKYLKAVCDGESAKYACDEVIQTLNLRLGNLQYETQRAEPTKPNRSSFDYGRRPVDEKFDKGEAARVGCITVPILWFVLSALLCELYGALISRWVDVTNPVMLISVFLSLAIYLVICKVRISIVEAKNADKQAAYDANVDQRYHNALQIYNDSMEEHNKYLRQYRQSCDIIDAKRDTLRHIISGYEAMKSEIEKQLSALYDRGIIYERFRDIVAVHQIREYLEAGVCDELEGKDGAYAMYYNDIRTAKITDSISDLKHSMIDALDRLGNRLSHSFSMAQRSIINELQITNNNLRALNGTIDNSLRGINSRMDGLSHTLDMQRRELSEANVYAQSIERAVTASAYNDYIIKRLDSMGDYDRLHRLKDPRS